MRRPTGSPRRRLIILALVAVAAMIGVPFAPPASAASPEAGSVTLTVLSVSPTSPTPSYTPNPLTITFRLRNNTTQTLPRISVSGVRGNPINDQQSLDSAMAHPTTPPDQFASPIDVGTLTVDDLAPGSTQDAIFSTTTDIPQDAGICECANAIYPLFFSATAEVDGRTVTLGTAQTYIPSFEITNPAKLQVGWVWPLLDVPHRLTSSTVFLDDDLAAEVAPGGRLDRALTVLETVSQTVPMTVITDPDLLDELEVMADGDYEVQHTGAAATPGIGSGAAAAWLARLRAVFTAHPDVELSLTAYGDPDVDALQQNGLSWTSGLPTAVQARVTTALGGLTPLSDIAWPLGETLSADTLQSLVRQGTQTVILSSATLPKVLGGNPAQDTMAALTTPAGPATAAITTPAIEAWAAKVLQPTGAGASFLPELVSQVALHAVASPDESHFVFIAPPRILDVDPNVAEQAIYDTSTAVWATPLPLRKATTAIEAKATSVVAPQRTTTFPAPTLRALHYINDDLPRLSTLFLDADRQAALGSIPTAAQLAASSSLVSEPQQSVLYSNRLVAIFSAYRHGVYLVQPNIKRGDTFYTYTLTSTNSSLPVTIANDLAIPVKVDVSGDALGGVSGFTATAIQSKQIAPHSTVQVRLPTHFDRTGRIEVEVSLETPSGLQLGDPIQLHVRSTALGTVGIVITAVAGVVLVGALLVRALRRLRKRRRKPAEVAA